MLPRTRLKTKGDRSFEVVAPTLWNALPINLRSAVSVDAFRKQLKTLVSTVVLFCLMFIILGFILLILIEIAFVVACLFSVLDPIVF